MKIKSIILTTILFACAQIVGATAADDKKPAEKKKPLVQIAILLDTSNSMDGLIAQAKSQLWKICNEFIKAKQGGATPEVQVALYEYGNNGLDGKTGWIRRVQPLTTDLDKISEELFALKTNGGDEYCGWVIKDAVKDLDWSARPDVYKVIFIAGNEPFTQGPVNYAESCKAAISKGIMVNTIHCGTEREGVEGKWKDGAQLADGKYLVIDQDRAVVSIEAPQDKEIAQLGIELNKTYIAFGAEGRTGSSRQVEQDANAAKLVSAGAPVARAVSKASAVYSNARWDLVDAAKEKIFDLTKVKKDELPAEMQKMNESERKSYVETKTKDRDELQAKIKHLNSEREKYVAQKTKESAGNNTLDTAMIAAVREQGAKRSFVFE